MKKLCIILPHHWAFNMGGSEYQIKCLMESGALNGMFDTSIVSRRLSNGYTPNGYRLVSIVKPFALQRFGLVFDAPFLYRKLKELAPDVIYQGIGTSYAGIATYYARKAGCKMVLRIASDSDVVPFQGKIRAKSLIPYIEKKAYEYAIRNARNIISQTYVQKRLLRLNYGRQVDAVIRNFQPIPKEKIDKCPPVKVLWVANFKRLKQPDMFIRLAKDLSEAKLPAEFIMIGRPELDNQWQRSLEEMIDGTPNLTYLGGRTIDEVNQVFAKSHILVNTSQYEGFSNTFIQAWMRCVPVVSLNSNPDGLLDAKNLGLISGSYRQLCNDVKRLIIDETLRQRMGQGAYAYAMNHFSMENVKQVLDIIRHD